MVKWELRVLLKGDQQGWDLNTNGLVTKNYNQRATNGSKLKDQHYISLKSAARGADLAAFLWTVSEKADSVISDL